MTSLQIFAFVVLPLVILALGYVGVRYTEWDLRRRDRLHPGE